MQKISLTGVLVSLSALSAMSSYIKQTYTQEGQTVTLVCDIHHDITELQWSYLNDITLSQNHRINPWLDDSFKSRLNIISDRIDRSYDLQIRNVRKTDEGNYTCKTVSGVRFIVVYLKIIDKTTVEWDKTAKIENQTKDDQSINNGVDVKYLLEYLFHGLPWVAFFLVLVVIFCLIKKCRSQVHSMKQVAVIKYKEGKQAEGTQLEADVDCSNRDSEIPSSEELKQAYEIMTSNRNKTISNVYEIPD